MAHMETVHAIYQAFGQGNVPAILDRLAPDVEWEYGQGPTTVPWLQPRRGRAAVVGFFEALADLEIRRFEPTAFLESGDTVVVLIQLEATVRSTGRTFAEADEVHIWHFNAQGQVARFRHRVDTEQHAAACAMPEATLL